MHVRSLALATLVCLSTIAVAFPTSAAADENHCLTTVFFGFRELVIAPVIGDAVGVVVGTPLTPLGAGLAVIIRPHACGVGSALNAGTVRSTGALQSAPSLDSVLPILP